MTILIHSATPLSLVDLNLRALDTWRRAARRVSDELAYRTLRAAA